MADLGAVAAAFGLGSLREQPLSVAVGEQGRVWMVSTPRGRWAVKQLSSDLAHDRTADARAFTAASARRIPMPESVVTDDGLLLLDGEAVGEPGTWFRVMEWLDLDSSAPVGESDLGKLAAAIHQVDCATTRDVDSWFAAGVDDDVWAALLESARASQADWLMQLHRRLPMLRRLRELTQVRPGRPLVSHRDLNMSNLARTVSGELVILDWDLCGPIDPRRELAVVVAQHALSDWDGAIVLYSAYVGAGGPVRLDALDAFASVSIAGDNLTYLYAQRALDQPNDTAARERLEWVFSTVDTVTLPWLEDLLDRLNAVDA